MAETLSKPAVAAGQRVTLPSGRPGIVVELVSEAGGLERAEVRYSDGGDDEVTLPLSLLKPRLNRRHERG
jgi:hypothetical protein